MHDTACLASTYCNMVHIYWGTSEGNMLHVHRPSGFSILFQLSSSGGGGGLLCRDKLNPKVLSKEELLIVLRRQINIDRDQKAVMIDQMNSRHLWPIVANATSCLPACLSACLSACLPFLSCADRTFPVGKLSAIICRGLCTNFVMALCQFT
jgi:hypothetical protein